MQRKESEMLGTLNTINNSQAFIQFDLDGNIIKANDIFCRTMKYSFNEIKGKHHRIFVERDYVESAEYREFWESFKNGKSRTGEFERKAKDGFSVWLSASYSTIVNAQGKAMKVIKLARDISKEKQIRELCQKQAETIKILEEKLTQKEKEYLKPVRELEHTSQVTK
jgi:methyl-accepting chemotaxis protein